MGSSRLSTHAAKKQSQANITLPQAYLEILEIKAEKLAEFGRCLRLQTLTKTLHPPTISTASFALERETSAID